MTPGAFFYEKQETILACLGIVSSSLLKWKDEIRILIGKEEFKRVSKLHINGGQYV